MKVSSIRNAIFQSIVTINGKHLFLHIKRIIFVKITAEAFLFYLRYRTHDASSIILTNLSSIITIIMSRKPRVIAIVKLLNFKIHFVAL